MDDICDKDDRTELRKMLAEEFCTRLIDQKGADVGPAFEFASKEFIESYGKSLIFKVCEQQDSHSIGCLENIANALDMS